jgi:hypothetical protein
MVIRFLCFFLAPLALSGMGTGSDSSFDPTTAALLGVVLVGLLGLRKWSRDRVDGGF